jgi:hypothetical protein
MDTATQVSGHAAGMATDTAGAPESAVDGARLGHGSSALMARGLCHAARIAGRTRLIAALGTTGQHLKPERR